MLPSSAEPDLGIFVSRLADELGRQGHELASVGIDRRGGSKAKHLQLVAEAVRAARQARPDVVYGHFLFPAGAAAALAARAGRAPLVLTAHGGDVRNLANPAIRRATRLVLRRTATLVAVSEYLREQLLLYLPQAEARGRIEVVDCGVDLSRFAAADQAEARAELALTGEGPVYLFVGSLDEQKNVLRLVEAFRRVGRGQLVLVGDGPLRARIDADERVRLVGRVQPDAIPRWLAAADVVCQPSLAEGFGLVLLEAMACCRPVVASHSGAPPEFVVPGAGVLVDPYQVGDIARGLREAAELPVPNGAARAEAERHDLRHQAARIAEILARAQ